jgi:hypothetical protein
VAPYTGYGDFRVAFYFCNHFFTPPQYSSAGGQEFRTFPTWGTLSLSEGPQRTREAPDFGSRWAVCQFLQRSAKLWRSHALPPARLLSSSPPCCSCSARPSSPPPLTGNHLSPLSYSSDSICKTLIGKRGMFSRTHVLVVSNFLFASFLLRIFISKSTGFRIRDEKCSRQVLRSWFSRMSIHANNLADFQLVSRSRGVVEFCSECHLTLLQPLSCDYLNLNVKCLYPESYMLISAHCL